MLSACCHFYFGMVFHLISFGLGHLYRSVAPVRSIFCSVPSSGGGHLFGVGGCLHMHAERIHVCRHIFLLLLSRLVVTMAIILVGWFVCSYMRRLCRGAGEQTIPHQCLQLCFTSCIIWEIGPPAPACSGRRYRRGVWWLDPSPATYFS